MDIFLKKLVKLLSDKKIKKNLKLIHRLLIITSSKLKIEIVKNFKTYILQYLIRNFVRLNNTRFTDFNQIIRH